MCPLNRKHLWWFCILSETQSSTLKQSLFFLYYHGNSRNLSGVFIKHYWHILTRALHSYWVAITETKRRRNCNPAEATDITQQTSEPILPRDRASLITGLSDKPTVLGYTTVFFFFTILKLVLESRLWN